MHKNKVRVNYDRYEMSEARYDELAAFVRQYREFIRDKSALSQERAELIESCARDACPFDVFSAGLLRHLADGLTFEQLALPISRAEFYKQRRRFFMLLNERKP